jgi:uncharacterized membrane protein
MQGSYDGAAFDEGGAMPEVMRRPRFPTTAGHEESRTLGATSPERLAHRLGWFSISLGLAEVLAPRLLSRLLVGSDRYANLIRLYGARELASALMIFAQGARPTAAMWSRVAGDAVDIATLVAAGASPRTNRGGVAIAAASVLGGTALDVYCARQLSREPRAEPGIRMTRSVVVNRPPHDLYAFWREFENFPRFMFHVQSVRRTGPGITHWVVNGPAGATVEWDARITSDIPNEVIAWQSLDGSQVDNRGVVRFEPRPGGRGTIVRVDLLYQPPAGRAGKLVAMLFNESPEQQIYDDLHRFKQVVETGEVMRSDGSPDGMGDVLQQPAQPLPRRRTIASDTPKSSHEESSGGTR